MLIGAKIENFKYDILSNFQTIQFCQNLLFGQKLDFWNSVGSFLYYGAQSSETLRNDNYHVLKDQLFWNTFVKEFTLKKCCSLLIIMLCSFMGQIHVTFFWVRKSRAARDVWFFWCTLYRVCTYVWYMVLNLFIAHKG